MHHLSLLLVLCLGLYLCFTPEPVLGNTEKVIFTVSHGSEAPSAGSDTRLEGRCTATDPVEWKRLSSPHTLVRAETVQPSYYKEDVTIAALVRDIANSSYSSTLLQDLKTGNDLQNRDFKWYVLENLDHGASYELRVSYPATSPADFEIMVWTLSEAQDHCAQDVRLDKLFDKHIMIARIKATYTGVSYRSNGVSGPEVRPIPFNLVLERLYFMIPYQALKLAAAIAGVVMVGLGYMVPKIHRALLNAASRGILKDDMTQRKTE